MPKLFVIAHNIRSAYNVGSIFRSADSAGVDKLFLTGYSPSPDHPKVAKTSLGSEHYLKWEHHCGLISLLDLLKSQSVKIVGLETHIKATSIVEAAFDSDTALIVGNEVEGIPSQILDVTDEVIKIPHYGHKESLNVAVAAGVAVYLYQLKRTQAR